MASGYTSDNHQVIVEALGGYLRENLRGKKRISIPCPFHNETMPSLYINLDPNNKKNAIGGYYCFGCRAKTSTHGGWNGLAEKLGLPTIDGSGAQITNHVRREIDEAALFNAEDGMPIDKLMEYWGIDFHTPWPDTMKWRGFPGWLMQRLGAWLAFDATRERQVCVIPQWNGDTLTGAVKCLIGNIRKKDKPFKYLSAPGEWVKTHALYPFHVVEWMLDQHEDRTVVLVEGPRDAIRLIGCGIPALALLGTNNWSDQKRDLLMTLDPDRVIMGFDNDKAGIGAMKLVSPSLKGFVHRSRLVYDEGVKDPGEAPIELIREWKRVFKIRTTAMRQAPLPYPEPY